MVILGSYASTNQMRLYGVADEEGQDEASKLRTRLEVGNHFFGGGLLQTIPNIFNIHAYITGFSTVIHDLETCYWTTKGIAILKILCPHRKTVERRSKPLGTCSFHGLYGLRGLAELFGNRARLHADRFSNAGFCSVAWVNQRKLCVLRLNS